MFYLYTDDTAPATAVLTFIYCLIAVAKSIKPQDSPHTVTYEAYLERSKIRITFLKTLWLSCT